MLTSALYFVELTNHRDFDIIPLSISKRRKMTKSEALANGFTPYYVGYYRESAKYRTEWIDVIGSYDRHIVKDKLDKIIRQDRANHHYGSRVKIKIKGIETGNH